MAADELTRLRLAPGLAMNLEVLGGDGQRHKGVFLGMISGRSVMMSTPLVGENRPLLLRKDQPVVCRFFDQKIACAFRSQVLYLCTTPIHYLHLAWPTDVEVGHVRVSERVVANLQMNVVNQSDISWDKSHGAIVDLSISGARLETVEPVGNIGDKIVLSGRVVVGHVARLVTIEATLRAELDKFELSNSTAAYGIEFNYISDVDFLALKAFVNGQLVKGAAR
ncbi:flagellar brake protein [Reinekea marinisedimentorum]|uniref:Flagellar protein YcgR n=1 Tax=Reinekea marinisedimentorum TaxID=230495 RepID=A0A4V2UIV2_9GAMM|nr:flagellar brake protein [Reinekea marinisedimentorum]TCS37600.1 flagellar protein YcgR [Reinekea marinisedimentorum]